MDTSLRWEDRGDCVASKALAEVEILRRKTKSTWEGRDSVPSSPRHDFLMGRSFFEVEQLLGFVHFSGGLQKKAKRFANTTVEVGFSTQEQLSMPNMFKCRSGPSTPAVPTSPHNVGFS